MAAAIAGPAAAGEGTDDVASPSAFLSLLVLELSPGCLTGLVSPLDFATSPAAACSADFAAALPSIGVVVPAGCGAPCACGAGAGLPFAWAASAITPASTDFLPVWPSVLLPVGSSPLA